MARIRALPLTSNDAAREPKGVRQGSNKGTPREFTMLGGYSDVNWFLRAARLAPVIAGAALLGGMIGGFAMFAIDSALTWEPTWEPVSQPRLDVRA
ncbi:MAG: hypothetical protein ACLQF4_05165, partial [Xanthobacteraceae bacterium]